MKAIYETAYELEPDQVIGIVEKRPERPARMARRARRQGGMILSVVNTVCATLTVIAASTGDWQSAFAGSILLLILVLTGRVLE